MKKQEYKFGDILDDINSIFFKKEYLNLDYKDSVLYEDCYYYKPGRYKKNIYKKLDTSLSGIIIGQTVRKEGNLITDDSDYADFYPHAVGYHFVIEKIVSFWVVAIGLNKTVLVPKDLNNL